MAYTDDFARSDNVDLGANWTPVASSGNFEIIGGAVRADSGLVDTAEVYSAGTFADDQYSQAVISSMTTGTGDQTGIGVCVRGDTASKSMYWAVVNAAASNNVSVHKFVSGSATLLAQRTQAFSSTDTLKLEITGQDASIVLKVYRNGTQIGADIADSSGSHVNTGKAGLAYSSNTGDQPTLDNWEGGDLSGGLVTGSSTFPITVTVGSDGVSIQTLNPSADSADGNWTTDTGGTALAAAIDEDSASDSDYIRSEFGPSNSGCRVKLESLNDPTSSAGHIIRWRTGKNATGGATINMTVKLMQGGANVLGAGTQIASFNRNNVDSLTTYAESLSGAEADAITDYSDLYLEFYANQA